MKYERLTKGTLNGERLGVQPNLAALNNRLYELENKIERGLLVECPCMASAPSCIDDMLVFESPSFEDALIGVTEDGRAVYDYMKMVGWLIEQEYMTEEDAEEWITYNTIRALPYMGDKAPLIMYPLADLK